MRRFFQSAAPVGDGTMSLTGAEAHHASQVIRLSEGDAATVMDGRGGEYFCTVIGVGRRELLMRVNQKLQHNPPALRLRLVQAMTKSKSFETILQKAVELGVSEIQPLITSRVIARPDERDLANKRQKWRQLLVEALKQCGATWLPEMLEPRPFREVLAHNRGLDLCLVAALSEAAVHPRTVIDEYCHTHGGLPIKVSIWIGPEGDFTSTELAELVESGARPVRIGPNVLRSETAAVSALAILQYEFAAPRNSLATGSMP
jgi:16S rRNA (uracil1498-N3)-methyltransferase